MKLSAVLLAAALLLACSPLDADDAAVRERLATQLPGVTADDIRPSGLPGIYEVMVGPRIVYVSEDGAYLIQGTVVRLADHQNVTEPRRAAARARWAAKLDEDEMVIFDPPGDVRHTITVFTDVDCGYCREMHAEIDELLGKGVRVRYVLYPRSGPGSPGVRRAESVWCAADRHDAITRAKLGEMITSPRCETPLMSSMMLGRELPVTGTPTTVTEDGTLIPGYLPPQQLFAELERRRAAAADR